ncbi:MAG: hypothetical protein K6F64_04665 [Clostridia bacterium]|nr:hypothetical protein [Clostridia bacterium]
MKRKLALLFALIFTVLNFSSCTFGGPKTALVISGTDIDEEVYNYYYNRVEQRPADYGINSDSEKDIKEKTIELCTRYLAFNTSFKNRGLSLTISEKVSVSDRVNNDWLRNKKLYESKNISRKTINKILTSEAYEDAIFNSIFDKGVRDEANEKKNKEYFYSNYLAFRNICAYFTDSNGKPITEQQKTDLIAQFNEIAASSVGDYQLFSDVCSSYGYSASDTIILSKESQGYPDGFYDSVDEMPYGTISVLTYSDVIFIVRKENIEELGEGLYASYRSECIKEMYEDRWEQIVKDYCAGFEVDKK